MDACAPTRGVVRLDVGGGRLGGNAEGKKSFRLAFFHAATQTSTARQRVASTRKREATSQSTEGPLKLTVEASERDAFNFPFNFLAIFWHRSDRRRVPLLLETLLFGVCDWSMWDGKARVN